VVGATRRPYQSQPLSDRGYESYPRMQAVLAPVAVSGCTLLQRQSMCASLQTSLHSTVQRPVGAVCCFRPLLMRPLPHEQEVCHVGHVAMLALSVDKLAQAVLPCQGRC